MRVGKVIGTIVSTRKLDSLVGSKFLEVELIEGGKKTGGYIIAIDTVGAGIGEMVLMTGGGSARHAFTAEKVPCDTAIVGIVDTMSHLEK